MILVKKSLAIIATIIIGMQLQVIAQPLISFNPGSINAIVMACDDSIAIPLTVYNTGSTTLNFTAWGETNTPHIGYGYLTNYANTSVDVYDLNTHTFVTAVPVDSDPGRISFHPSGELVYCSNGAYYSGNTLSVIRTSDNTEIANIAVGDYAGGMAFLPSGAFGYVTGEDSDVLTKINCSTHTVSKTIAVTGSPRDIAITPDGQLAYIATRNNGIQIVDLTTDAVVGNVGGVPGHSIVISPDGQYVYVTGGGYGSGIVVIETATNTILTTILSPSGAYLHELAITQDGNTIYVGGYSPNELYVVDLATNTIVNTITDPAFSSASYGLWGMELGPDDEFCYVVINWNGSPQVVVIETATNTITTSFGSGDAFSFAAHRAGTAWLSTSAMSGTIAAGDSATIMVSFDGLGLPSGTYTGNVVISSNDSNSLQSVPVTFTIDGVPTLDISANCADLDTAMLYATNTAPLWIYNTGCDTLFVTSITNTSAEFSSDTNQLIVLPYDSTLLTASFYPTALGAYVDTFIITTNDVDTTVCLSGFAIPAPTITFSSNPIVVSTTNCCDTTAFPLTVYNTGAADLIYNSALEAYDSTQTTVFTTSGAFTSFTFTGLPPGGDTLFVTITLNGDFDGGGEMCELYIDGDYLGIINDGNPTNGVDAVIDYAFTGAQLQSWLSDGEIVVDLANDGSVGTFVGTEIHEAHLLIKPSSWLVASTGVLDTIAPGDSVIFDVELISCGLTGTINSNLYFTSNDPVSPTVVIPLEFEINGPPDVSIIAGCVNFGTIQELAVAVDSFEVQNIGCTPLTFTDGNTTLAEYTLSDTSGVILPGESAYILVTFAPLVPGNYLDTITLLNDDVDTIICLAGVAVAAPTISVAPDSLSSTILNCCASDIQTFKVYNTGAADLNISVTTPGLGVTADVTLDTIVPGDSVIVTVTFNSCGVNSGTYMDNVLIASNDPQTAVETVATWFTIDGVPQVDIVGTCLDLDTIMEYNSVVDSFAINNTGCDTLFVTDASNLLGTYTLSDTAMYILPGNSAYILVTFAPINSGIYLDTIEILNNDIDTSICLVGVALESPTFSTDPDSISVVLAACDDSLLVPLTIYNTGNADLIYTHSTTTYSPENGVAYVTNRNSNSVSVIDLTADTVLATVGVGSSPQRATLRPGGEHVYVSNRNSNTISVIQTSDNTIAATISVGSYPTGIAFTADGQFAYVGNRYSDNVAKIDCNTMSVIATLTDSIGNPQDVLISGNGAFMYVACNNNYGLTVYDVATDLVVTSIVTPGNLHSLAMSPNGLFLYASLQGGNNIVVFSTLTNSIITTIPGFNSPHEMDFTPDGNFLYVANRRSDNVIVVDVLTNTIAVTIPSLNDPWGLEIRDDYCYVSNRSGFPAFNVIDITSNTIVSTLALPGSNSYGMAIRGVGAPWLATIPNIADTIVAGDSTTIMVYVEGDGLLSGTYTGDIIMASNDPLLPSDTISVTFEVVGAPAITLSDTCSYVDSIVQFASAENSFSIYNDGCDTLFISDLNNTLSEYTISDTSAVLLPGDSINITVTFAPLTAGLFQDTIVFLSNDTTISHCLYGYGFLQPIISSAPDTVSVTSSNCCDTTLETITVYNTGGSDLQYEKYKPNFYEDFENGLGRWAVNGSWAITSDAHEGLGALAENAIGSYTNNMNQSISLIDNLVIGDAANCVLTFMDKWDMECCCDYFETEISVNNGAYISLSSVNCNSTPYALETFPLSAYLVDGDSLRVRFLFNSDGSVTGPGAEVDSIVITGVGSSTSWVTINPTADTVPMGDSSIINLEFITCGLAGGSYTETLVLASNDPLMPLDTTILVFDVLGSPDIALVDTCSYMDSIIQFTAMVDSFEIQNNGCADLVITDLNNMLPEYSLSDTSATLLPGESITIAVTFAPLTAGFFQDTVVIISNDTTISHCLYGYGFLQPIVSIVPDSINLTSNNCCDTTLGTVTVYNTGGSDLIYQAPPVQDFFETFENGLGNWVTTGAWAITPDPFQGSFALAENASGPYVNSMNQSATMKQNVFVRDAANCVLTYMHKRDLECCPCDILETEISVNNGSYISVSSVNCTDFAYSLYTFPLSGYVNNGDSLKVRFVFTSDASQTAAGVEIDNVRITGLGEWPDWLTANPTVDTIPMGDSSVISLEFSSCGLITGDYEGRFAINSNDPLNPSNAVDLYFTLNGYPVVSSSDTCLDFDTLLQYTSDSRTIKLYNTGCDTLFVDSISSVLSVYTIDSTMFALAPSDSILLTAMFAPTTVGAQPDTLSVFSNDSTLEICLMGVALPPPVVSALPSPIGLTITACTDTVSTTLQVYNTGGTELIYSIDTVGVSFILDMVLDTVAVGDSSAIDVMFDVTGLSPGTYMDSIVISSNDPITPELIVPTTVIISPVPTMPVAGDMSICFGNANPTFSATGDIGNTGDTIYWFSDAALTIAVDTGDTFTPGDVAIGSYTYYLTYVLDSCSSPADSATFYINTAPSAPVAGDDSSCFADTVPDLTSTGTFVLWYDDALLTNQVGSGTSFPTGETAIGTYTYYLVDSVAGCPSGGSDTAMLSILGLPASPVADDTTICEGDSVPQLIALGTNISWYDNVLPSPAISTNDSLTTGETTGGVYVYYVTQNLTGCASFPDTATLTINSTTPPTTTDNAICFNSATTPLIAVGDSIKWYSDAALAVFEFQGDSLYASDVAVGTYTYWATAMDLTTGCTSLSDSAVYTIDATPIAPVASDIAACVGTAMPDLTAVGTGILWYQNVALDTVVSTGSPFATGDTTVGVHTYYVTQTVGGCESPADTATLTTIALPSAPVTSDSLICFGTATPDFIGSGTNVRWYSDAGLTSMVFAGDTFTSGVTAVGAHTYYATDSVAGCVGPASMMTVTIAAPPATPVVADVAICFGTATPDLVYVGSNTQWYDDGALTNMVASADTFITGVTATTVYTYYVTDSTMGCAESASDTVTLTINGIPAAPATSDMVVCDGDPVPSFVATGTGVQWYADSLLSPVLFAGDTFASGDSSPGSYDYFVTQTIAGCEGLANTAILTINAVPAAPTASDEAMCLGTSVPDLVATGTNPIWYSDSSLTTMVFAGSTFATGNTAVGVYTYYVTDSINGCPGPSTTVTLTISAGLSAPPVASNITACEGSVIPDFTATGTNLTWYSDSALTTLVFTGSPFASGNTANGTYTYYVRDSIGGCAGPAAAVTLTINASPVVTLSSYSETILAGDSVTVVASGADTYIWSPSAGLNTTSGATVTANPSITTQYTVSGTNSFGCSADTVLLVIVDTGTFIVETDFVQNVQIFPNPSTGVFELVFTSNLVDPIEIRIINAIGEITLREDAKLNSGSFHKEFNLTQMASGVYYIQLASEKGIVTKKMVILLDY